MEVCVKDYYVFFFDLSAFWLWLFFIGGGGGGGEKIDLQVFPKVLTKLPLYETTKIS